MYEEHLTLPDDDGWEPCVDMQGRPRMRPIMRLPEGARVLNADQIPENTVVYPKDDATPGEMPFTMVSIFSLRRRAAAAVA